MKYESPANYGDDIIVTNKSVKGWQGLLKTFIWITIIVGAIVGDKIFVAPIAMVSSLVKEDLIISFFFFENRKCPGFFPSGHKCGVM